MDEFKLFSVTTTATWVTEYSGYVMAYSIEEACKAVKTIDDEVPLSEFKEMISPEQLEKFRIAKIEKNNGQLDLTLGI